MICNQCNNKIKIQIILTFLIVLCFSCSSSRKKADFTGNIDTLSKNIDTASNKIKILNPVITKKKIKYRYNKLTYFCIDRSTTSNWDNNYTVISEDERNKLFNNSNFYYNPDYIYYYYSNQYNSDTLKALTVIYTNDASFVNIDLLVYDKTRKLINQMTLAKSEGDGGYLLLGRGKFTNTGLYIYTEVETKNYSPFKEDPYISIDSIDSTIIKFKVSPYFQFKKLEEKKYKYQIKYK